MELFRKYRIPPANGLETVWPTYYFSDYQMNELIEQFTKYQKFSLAVDSDGIPVEEKREADA